MTDTDQPTGGLSDDDPPSDQPFLTPEHRIAHTATIMRTLWRIVWLVTDRGKKPLPTIGLYCCDVKYVYYAVHPSDRSTSFARIESVRHAVDGPIHESSIRHLSDRQLEQLLVIVTYELKRLTELRQKGQ